MSKAYPKLTSGEAFEMKLKRGRSALLKFGCCDCGLVHRMAFATDGKALGIAVERDTRATAAARRRMKGLKIPKGGAFAGK